MDSRQLLRALTASCMVLVASCGGGGGEGGNPSPSPPSPSPPSPSPPAPAPPSPPPDTTAPETTLSVTPPVRGSSTSATFTVTSNEAGATFEASVDGGEFNAVTATFTIDNLAEGTHAISVRARDAAENVDATPATAEWAVDLTAPVVDIVFPTPLSYTDATQLHVRGTAHDGAGTVASVTINGIDATTTDGFAHWTATVSIVVGDNTLFVSTTDDLGNVATRAQAVVANRGAMLDVIEHIAFDAAGQRLLAVDSEQRALVGIRAPDRYAAIISDATHGSGPLLQQPKGVALDGTRALVTDVSSDVLVAVDLATGNRTVLSPSPNDPALRLGGGVTYDSTTQRVYATTFESVLCIDLANGGARTIVSGGGVGTGAPFIGLYGGIVIDSTAASPTLLVADSTGHAIVSVDIATGDRTPLTYAAPLDLENAVGGGPAVYGLGQLQLDAANERLLVADVGPMSWAGRLLSVSLTNGDRAVLTPGTNEIPLNLALGLAVDEAGGRVFISSRERARISQFELAASSLTRFHDSLVGAGPAMSGAPGLLLSSAAGSPGLYVMRQDPDHLVQRVDLTTGNRATVSIFGNAGTGPQWGETVGNLAADARTGMSGHALALDTVADVISLRGLDLVSGDRSIIASAQLPGPRVLSHMSLDIELNRAIVGLNLPGSAGASNLAAMDLTTGVVTDIASLSVGNGAPMYDITSVVVLPTTFPVTTAGRILVGSPSSLLRVNGSGDRNFVNGLGPSLVPIQDMAPDLARRRVLVGGSDGRALQWVDLDSGNRTMASGLNPDTHAVTGEGPPIFGYPFAMALDSESDLAYATVMGTAVMAIDLVSGDRIVISR